MKRFALLLTLVPSVALALGPVKLTPKELKVNAIQAKLSSTMHTDPTKVEISLKGAHWTASDLSTFTGGAKPGPAVERTFAEGTIEKSGNLYDVSVQPIDR